MSAAVFVLLLLVTSALGTIDYKAIFDLVDVGHDGLVSLDDAFGGRQYLSKRVLTDDDIKSK